MSSNVALFAGPDSQLWVTDGTQGGTSELSVAGTEPFSIPTFLSNGTGFYPSGFTQFGSEVLFSGYDASNHLNLWVTNGTAAGTSELSVAGTSSLQAVGMTVLGSEALFSSGVNLWVTNGTAAGTSELSVAGANATVGLNPVNLTVLGSEALFEGIDAASHENLWVTNGTAAGTSELSVAGASASGLKPVNFFVFGSKALFAGTDAAGNNNLWVTDGTAAGTSEIGTASGGLQPGNFTVFGSEVLFIGNGNTLWATDGTAAGTSEIMGATPSNMSGLITLGSEVLFSNGAGLWVTNGTAAGTSELSVASAFSSPNGFTAFGSEVLFNARNASGAYEVWLTDGTAAGTSELSVPGLSLLGTGPSFTVVGSEALFSASTGLWETNGTVAGTSELSTPITSPIGVNIGSIGGVTLDLPRLTGVTASPASGVAVAGQTITLTLAFNLPMTVSGGTPELFLNNGGTATYDAAATAALGDPTRLVFDYTVTAGNGNVSALAVAGGSFNGATILDAAGNVPDFSHLDTVFPGLSVATSPAVTSVTASQTSGTLHIGQAITFTVNFNESVTVSGGTPTLYLNDGGAATYDAAATAALGDPTKLVFDYTVAASDYNVSALAIVDGGLNGATIQNGVGQSANYDHLPTTFSSLAVATHPVATSIAASPATGVEGVGQTITFTVTMSEAVTVSGGTPILFLDDGGAATYNAAATAALGDPTRLVFTYTVAATDHNVGSLAVTGASFNGATITDAGGNSLTDASAAFKTFANLGVQTAPNTTVTSITASSNLVSQTGQVLQLTLTMSSPVTVSDGTPSMTLNDGGTAVYDAAATAALGDPTKLVFDYTAGASDLDESALTVTGASVNGAIITDAAGNGPDFSGIFSLLPPIQVQFVPPTVTSVTASPASGEVTTGQVVDITLNFSAPVKPLGLTQNLELLLNDGAVATYDAAHSTSTSLVFDYTVGANDVTTDLTVSGLAALSAGSFEELIVDTHFDTASVAGAGASLGLQINTPNSGPPGPGTGSFTVSNVPPTLTTPDLAGTVEIFGPSAAALTFAPSPFIAETIELYDSQAFTGTIAGMGAPFDKLDLADIGFSSQTTLGYTANSANTGGTLTVSDGTHTANIALIGSFTASSFVTTSDGHGGTLITDPPAAQQAALAQPHHT